MTISDSPRIYVASLSDYNNGELTGRWIAADQDADSIHEEIQAILRESHYGPAEEWAIHDADGFWGIEIGEYESLELVSAIGRGIGEHGEDFAAYVHALKEYWGSEPLNEDELSKFTDRLYGNWASLKDFAEYEADELGIYSFMDGVPPGFLGFIRFDINAYADKLESEYTVIRLAGSVFVFDMEAA
ncbi:antirestriction protein ArdA [Crossiella sp. NPDC003009]